ncbi:MAG: hypothetical protein J3K34DRAFT_517289 [Monoraphidium minutum]|nr:MAG: hypothetical protein J3K34DRAFT_517289 [Monoraphidium minutum]
MAHFGKAHLWRSPAKEEAAVGAAGAAPPAPAAAQPAGAASELAADVRAAPAAAAAPTAVTGAVAAAVPMAPPVAPAAFGTASVKRRKTATAAQRGKAAAAELGREEEGGEEDEDEEMARWEREEDAADARREWRRLRGERREAAAVGALAALRARGVPLPEQLSQVTSAADLQWGSRYANHNGFWRERFTARQEGDAAGLEWAPEEQHAFSAAYQRHSLDLAALSKAAGRSEEDCQRFYEQHGHAIGCDAFDHRHLLKQLHRQVAQQAAAAAMAAAAAAAAAAAVVRGAARGRKAARGRGARRGGGAPESSGSSDDGGAGDAQRAHVGVCAPGGGAGAAAVPWSESEFLEALEVAGSDWRRVAGLLAAAGHAGATAEVAAGYFSRSAGRVWPFHLAAHRADARAGRGDRSSAPFGDGPGASTPGSEAWGLDPELTSGRAEAVARMQQQQEEVRAYMAEERAAARRQRAAQSSARGQGPLAPEEGSLLLAALAAEPTLVWFDSIEAAEAHCGAHVRVRAVGGAVPSASAEALGGGGGNGGGGGGNGGGGGGGAELRLCGVDGRWALHGFVLEAVCRGEPLCFEALCTLGRDAKELACRGALQHIFGADMVSRAAAGRRAAPVQLAHTW